MWLMSDIEAVEHPRRRLTCRHDKKPSPRGNEGDGFLSRYMPGNGLSALRAEEGLA